MSLAAVLCREGGVGRGLDTVRQCIRQLEGLEVAVMAVMVRFVDRLKGCREQISESFTGSSGGLTGSLGNSDLTLPSLPSEYQDARENDLLVNKDYEQLFFITNFLSHIDASTPLIREEELEAAEIRKISLFSQKNKQKPFRKLVPNKEMPVVDHENYLKLFKNVLNKSKAQVNPTTEATAESTRGLSRRSGSHLRSESERRPTTTPFPSSQAYGTPPHSREISPNIALLQEIQRKKASLLRSRNIVETLQSEAMGRRRAKETIMVELEMKMKGVRAEVEARPVEWRRGKRML